jgi:hypothetical protein
LAHRREVELGGGKSKKPAGGESVSPGDEIKRLYVALMKLYKWTPKQIDEQDAALMFELFRIMNDEQEKAQFVPIDEVL